MNIIITIMKRIVVVIVIIIIVIIIIIIQLYILYFSYFSGIQQCPNSSKDTHRVDS